MDILSLVAVQMRPENQFCYKEPIPHPEPRPGSGPVLRSWLSSVRAGMQTLVGKGRGGPSDLARHIPAE
jgi:hypothetical protein